MLLNGALGSVSELFSLAVVIIWLLAARESLLTKLVGLAVPPGQEPRRVNSRRSERGSSCRLNEKFNPKSLITTMRDTSRLRYCESGYFRIGGEVVNKLRKNEKSLEATGLPAGFEPQVIDETEEGTGEIITSARPPQKTAKTDSPTKMKR